MRPTLHAFRVFLVLALPLGAAAQEAPAESPVAEEEAAAEEATDVASQRDFNVLLAPRPICLTPGVTFRLAEFLAAGPYIEGCYIDTGHTDTWTSALGGLLITKLGGDVYDSGFSSVTLASFEHHRFSTSKGSEGHANIGQFGQYIGYQLFFDSTGFNFWIGGGAFYIVVLESEVDVVAGESEGTLDNLDLQTSNRYFFFPGLLLAWAF